MVLGTEVWNPIWTPWWVARIQGLVFLLSPRMDMSWKLELRAELELENSHLDMEYAVTRVL